MMHRGPDAGGHWIDRNAGIALGHRRLSIIDLSQNGAQPMISASGRYVLSYNGEIYNAAEIRKDIEKDWYPFRGHSDTEVLLEACERYGVPEAVRRFIGMFVFALWDRKERILYLVRDRLGIKPVYWGQFEGIFVFGSELKALRACPFWKPVINRNALALFMRHNYVPAPHTIYQGIYKLQPGHILKFREGETGMEKYWDLSMHAQQGIAQPSTQSDQDAVAELESLLEDAVTRRLVADVPLGALLSGGIDSSLVVAMMSKSAHGRVRTYSIGFTDPGFNEAHHAKAVAKHLGTEHTELYVSPAEAQAVIPLLADIHDEPFADSSQIPTYLVSRLASAHVRVALSGDGGDEVFAGYNRYFHGGRIIRFMESTPDFAKNLCARMIRLFSEETWTAMNARLPGIIRIPQLGDKLYKLSEMLMADTSCTYQRLVSHWHDPFQIVMGAEETPGILTDQCFAPAVTGVIERMQLMDEITYLPDDILTKVDRASMAVSLEARVPLLDHRLVEYAWRIPLHMKIRHGRGKWILRQILYKYVPRRILERPKMGFGVPVSAWLRGPLQDWAETLLDENRIRREGYLNPLPIRRKWHDLLEGRGNWQYQLWNVLMFQAWLERWEN
jgi:asparagine synthase (glutamine-hydrolyzing)